MITKQVYYLLAVMILLVTSLLTACQPIQPTGEHTADTHTHAHVDAANVAPLLGNLGDHTHPIGSGAKVF